MQIEHMREYCVVADEKSIFSAAQRLHITQPVLSKHIRAIEDTLHNQLFFRSTKGIITTPQGRKVYEAFMEIIKRYDDLAEEIDVDESELCGQIRLGILTMGFDSYVGPLIHGFHQIHPNVSFSYATRQPDIILRDVLDGTLDAGFLGAVKTTNDSQLSFHCIGRDAIHFSVPANDPILGSKKVITPEDVQGRPLICLNTKETTDALNDLIINEGGYKPSKIIPIDELEIAAAEVSAKSGFFAIPDFMCSVFKTYHNVAIADPAEPLSMPVYFVSRSSVKNPLLNTFLQWVELRNQLDQEGTL